MLQVIHTKGWPKGRKRVGERIKVAAKKESFVMAEKASTTTNDQGQKRKALDLTALDLQATLEVQYTEGHRDV